MAPITSEATITPAPMQSNNSGMKKMGLTVLVLVALVAIAGGLYAQKGALLAMTGQTGAASAISAPSGFQAVFLTNGQVYFGEIKKEDGSYLTLNKVFYLQVKQPLQQADAKDAPASKPELNLVKLGTELHGPTDEMRVSRPQILFTETLKEDSQVVKGIGDYYTKNKELIFADTKRARQCYFLLSNF